MSQTNKVQLIGNLGANPKVTSLNDGKAVATVSLATHDYYKDENEVRQAKTEWHNLVAFGNLAGLFSKFLTKGSKVMVSGRLQTRQYVDKNEVQRYVTEVIVSEVLFLDNLDAREGSTK